MSRKKIVIIEDSSFVLNVYRHKLQGEGYDIFTSVDGESGLGLVESVQPDLVVLDLGLPRMSGVEVLQAIRRRSSPGELPVLVLSGSYSGQAVDAAWAAGATNVLSKSGDTPKRVVEVIRQTLAAA